ncbi:hypothetical protein CANCADRAFT_69234 [Tortispora caseinolytica NRRL Y-17796]|uniref:Chromatin modification-related protein EAF6 n=1 Tax=Tortispora caseinolytica NRRL Y-17796 TaxID=767744 RepID=A0A1E4THJ6_9ASCO|nr:hypothetical protein CANCADRAFT_69234 [Tortispora caseinolytica NRRL Y-17796]
MPTSTAVPDTTTYEKLKKQLKETLNKKKALDKALATVEDQIYRYETLYFDNTPNGNIVKGFEHYLKGTTSRRKSNTFDGDRIFSGSSVAFVRQMQKASSGADSEDNLSTKKANKKRKDESSDDSDADEIPAPKRVRIHIKNED